jgi:hypothetical protein
MVVLACRIFDEDIQPDRSTLPFGKRKKGSVFISKNSNLIEIAFTFADGIGSNKLQVVTALQQLVTRLALPQ